MARTQITTAAKELPLSKLPASALRAVFAEGYNKQKLKSDILSGAVVGIIALPLAMALAIAVGVPPQHGLYTAIIAGILVAFLGGSRFQVSGPTAAFVVILIPIYLNFGLAGLLLSGFFSGVILVALGMARFGKLIQFIPHPVTTGFTAGIGTVIAFLQFKDLFGLKVERSPDHFIDQVIAMIQASHTAHLTEFVVGITTLAMLLLIPKITKKIPAPLIALATAAVVCELLRRFIPDFQVITIQSKFHSVINGKEIFGIPQLPPIPTWPWSYPGANGAPFEMTLSNIRGLWPSSLAIAMLGAIESLLSAVIADGMGGTRHDPDSELIAIGVGNMICPFFGGIAATGAIARTATNIRYGAVSPISSMVHGIVVLIAIVAFAPLLSYLPMASLAALLLIVAWNMSDVKHFFHTIKVAPKSDVVVLIICYTLTVVFDMVTAVTTGVMLASLIFMRRMADTSSAKLFSHEDPSFRGKLPQGVMLYEISGPLFFGAADKAMDAMRTIGAHTKAIILNMKAVPIIDDTGLVAFESALEKLHKRNILVVIADIQKQPAEVLLNAGIYSASGKLEFSQSIDAAIQKFSTRSSLT